MDTMSILVAVAVGFSLSQVPRAIEALHALAKQRQRTLDDDYVRMRTALVTVHYWLTEQSKREDGATPSRQFMVWRDYISAILSGPVAPFAKPEPQADPAEKVAKAGTQS